jgi:hypothetical protein
MTDLTDRMVTPAAIKQFLAEMLRERKFAACLVGFVLRVGANNGEHTGIPAQPEETEEHRV